MIISHRYRFIFLKTEKTASSSLARLFEKIAGESDPLYPAEPRVRKELLRKNGTLEGVSFVGGTRGIRLYLPRLTGLHRHARASDVRRFLGPALLDRYRIITSERNPFDRQVSLFAHRRGATESLADFSALTCSATYNLLHYNPLDNWSIYTLDGKVCADHVIRFENLKDDLAAVLRGLGLDPERYKLTHAKHRRNSDGPNYRELYTDTAWRLVESWYRRELEHFGYEF